MTACAAEQLYDELLARSCALQTLTSAEAQPPLALQQHATTLIRDLLNRQSNPDDLVRLLHPTAELPPADLWWLTPLGQLLQNLACHDASKRSPQDPIGAGDPSRAVSLVPRV